MNYFELKAMRQSLGLTVAEATGLQGIEMEKRNFQYLEAGKVKVKNDIQDIFFNLGSQYHLCLTLLLRDLPDMQPDPDDYDPAKSYPKKPALPFFHNFELWQEKTGNNARHMWKIYQAVVGHLLLVGKLTRLDDAAAIPPNFEVWCWISGKYDHEPN